MTVRWTPNIFLLKHSLEWLQHGRQREHFWCNKIVFQFNQYRSWTAWIFFEFTQSIITNNIWCFQTDVIQDSVYRVFFVGDNVHSTSLLALIWGCSFRDTRNTIFTTCWIYKRRSSSCCVAIFHSNGGHRRKFNHRFLEGWNSIFKRS